MSLYAILPSNACPTTQPNNTASHFIIDLDSPLLLEGQWEVGLTEYSLNSFPISISFFITYYKLVKEGSLQYRLKGNQLFLECPSYLKYQVKGLSFTFTCIKPFTIIFQSKEVANIYGLNEKETISINNTIICNNVRFKDLLKYTKAQLIFTDAIEIADYIIFEQFLFFNYVDKMQTYFEKYCSVVLKDFKIDSNGYASFALKENVSLVILNKNVSKILGFLGRRYFYNNHGIMYKSNQNVQLLKPYSQIYISSNITDPILVGSEKISLLKSLCIKNKQDFYDIIHETIYQPMYLPISTDIINNIEINLTDEFGEIIPFPLGSKTSLTLHFRKDKQYNIESSIFSMDFYIILLSNTCPMSQPNNIASRFITDWESPLLLSGQWEVGLTEYFVNKIPNIIKTPIIIKYTRMSSQSDVVVLYTGPFKCKLLTHFSEDLKININDKGLVTVSSDRESFSIKFESKEVANLFGFDEIETLSKTKIITATKIITTNINTSFTVEIRYNTEAQINAEILFKQYLLFSNIDQIEQYFEKYCSEIFKEFKVNQNGYVYFSLKEDVNSLTIPDTLSRILGFGTQRIWDKYKFSYPFIAKERIQLSKPYSQIYIYSSILDPIIVGDVRVPLLQTMWIENNHVLDDVINVSIDRPMYLPISVYSINNIEIEIRDDYGKLIEFPSESKTSLTLHFRKKYE